MKETIYQMCKKKFYMDLARYGLWLGSNENVYLISEMDDTHLFNAHRLALRADSDRTPFLKRLTEELQERRNFKNQSLINLQEKFQKELEEKGYQAKVFFKEDFD